MPDHPPIPPAPGPASGPVVDLPGGGGVPERALAWSFSGSSGPGGQNVNKRATRATLRVTLTEMGLEGPVLARLKRLAGSLVNEAGELVISGDEHRSQARNKDACLARLGDLLQLARTRPKPRKKTKPSKGAVQRRIDAKKQRGEAKRRRRGPME